MIGCTGKISAAAMIGCTGKISAAAMIGCTGKISAAAGNGDYFMVDVVRGYLIDTRLSLLGGG